MNTASGANDETLMQRAKERAHDPAIFETNAPYFFAAEISNNRLDAYFTRMAPSSLQNYAKDSEAGVSFQNSHITRQLGLGATLSGQYTESGDIVRVTSDIFTISGLDDTESFLVKMRAGIARDVSIGFHGGEFRCSICGLDLFDWDCWHFPGVTYSVEDRNEKGEVVAVREEVAIAWIEDAHLSEVSIVYDGATPGCGILKATRDIEAGRMKPEIANSIRTAYRGAPIPGLDRFWSGYGEKEGLMTQRNDKSNSVPTQVSAPATLPGTESRTAGDAPQSNPSQSVDPDLTAVRSSVEAALKDAGVTTTDLATGLREIVSLARTGRTYRADLIEEALKEGVRIWGNDFKAETYRAMLEAADIEHIKQMRADWAGRATSLLPSGRQTEDSAPVEEKQEAPAAPKDSPALQLAPKSAFGG
jgi:hypothetical protein